MTTEQKVDRDRDMWQNLGANLITLIIIGVLGFIFAPQIDTYVKTLVPPNITVTPSDVEVAYPIDAMRDIHSKTLPKLTYYELSVLIDSEFTSFMRMYNHYNQKKSEKLKVMIKTQADRINTIQAYREERWVAENRQLGSRQNEFTPLKPVIDDVLKSLGIFEDGTDQKLDGGTDDTGSGESPK